MSRGLSNEFMEELKNGQLSPLRDAILHDQTLDLEIRDNYINVYYRGGNLLKVGIKGDKFFTYFDEEYLKYKKLPLKYSDRISRAKTVSEYIELIPYIKAEMDLSFYKGKKKIEREIQQQIIRENNYTRVAEDTDYFIVDVEHADDDSQEQNEKKDNKKGRFDMVALKWPSTSISHRSLPDIGLAFIELKYGIENVDGETGLFKHFKDLTSYLRQNSYPKICAEFQKVARQKAELGLFQLEKSLVNKLKSITIDPNKRPEIIFILANYKPASTKLRNELVKIMELYKNDPLKDTYEIKIANSCVMGYGLYERCMIPIEKFLESDYVN